jgi:hypothetical protein
MEWPRKGRVPPLGRTRCRNRHIGHMHAQTIQGKVGHAGKVHLARTPDTCKVHLVHARYTLRAHLIRARYT